MTPSQFDRLSWTPDCIRLATENGKDFQHQVEGLDVVASDTWIKQPIEDKCDNIAMQLRGFVGEGERVPLMLAPFRSDLNFTFHESTTGFKKATWVTGLSPSKMEADDPDLNGVVQKLYWKKLKLKKTLLEVEDELGDSFHKYATRAVKLNEQTSFTALQGLLSGCEDLIVKDIDLMNFKCLILATQNRPRGPNGHMLVLSGSSTMSQLEVRAQGETARTLWDQVLVTIGAALDMHVRLIMEVLHDESIDKTWRDALILTTKHVPAGLARKQRWEALCFDIRLAGIEFLAAPELAKAECPLRILLHAMADWLRKMLINVYQAPTRVTTKRRSIRDKSDPSLFPIFGPKYMDSFWRILDVWKRTWSSKWKVCRNAYSNKLKPKERKRELDASAREEDDFEETIGDLSDSFETKLNLVRTNTERGWENYRKYSLPRSIGSAAKKFNACIKCKKKGCWPCTIAKLTACLGDACKHAKNNGVPFLSTMKKTVYGVNMPVSLPQYIKTSVL